MKLLIDPNEKRCRFEQLRRGSNWNHLSRSRPEIIPVSERYEVILGE